MNVPACRVAALLGCLLVSGSLASADSRPNIVIVLCDDLGYGDLACYGEPHVRSPNLDRFASQSLRFTSCYSAAAVCSPARTGLMTGRTPFRAGVYSAIPFMSPMHMRSSEVTVASLLRDAGYETCHVGKWHMNGMFNLPGQPQPADHGFDYWFSTQNNALPNHRNPYNFVRNAIPAGRIEGYSADIVTSEAITWLRETRDAALPFFLYACFHEPHEPIATSQEHSEPYSGLKDPSRRAYLGNITQMDAAFGRLMRAIDELALTQNTFVFFTSDNGPALTRYHPYGSTGPLRAKKGHVYEGGIRVPGMLRYPGHTRAGSVSDVPISGVDVLPTVCEIAGVSLPDDRTTDGASLLPAISGKPIDRRSPLYWQYNRSLSDVKVAIRVGPWKLLARLDRPHPRAGGDITAEQMRVLKSASLTGFELYNLEDDISESRNRLESDPQQFKAMKQKLTTMYESVRSEAPVWPAWTSPRYEATRIEWPKYNALIKPPR